MAKRAAFIVIEGLDRSGKTTQTSLLHTRLESSGISTKLLKFPDRTTPIGKMIDSYLRSRSELDDHAIHLLFSANRWELAYASIFVPNLHPVDFFSPMISSLLNSGTTILCDRYAFSGIAFSAAKPSLASTFPNNDALPWCRAPDISLPAPDLTIFLDITPDQARLRGGYGEERYEKEEMQKRVREVFYRLGQEMGVEQGEGEINDGNKWVVVDAGRDREVVAEDLWKLVEPLAEGMNSSINRLWEDKLGAV